MRIPRPLERYFIRSCKICRNSDWRSKFSVLTKEINLSNDSSKIHEIHLLPNNKLIII